MKKKTIVILLVLIILLIGGGIVVWKLSSKEKTNSSSQQKPTTPLNQLSDQELEKCLLEDFSRRLELKKYFVFNLGKEIKTEKAFFNNKHSANSRVIKNSLSNDLTKLTNYLVEEGKIRKEIDTVNYKKMTKNAITFCGKDINTVPDKWTKDSLDKKITDGEQWWIIFDKSRVENERAYFTTIFKNGQDTNKLAWNGHVIIEVEKPGNYVAKTKSEALEFLKKNDTALSDDESL